MIIDALLLIKAFIKLCRRHRRCDFDSWLEEGMAIHSSILENHTEREAWQATVHWVTESNTTIPT